MRLVIIGDDSLPNSTLVHAKMLHELALSFQSQGHSVVIIAPGKPMQGKKLEVSNFDGVVYWKFRSGKLRGHGKLKRAINETLLSLNAWWAIRSRVIKEPFDGVIYYSPSIFFGHLAKKIKSLNGCKSYLILRDMFPQWAIDGGLIKPDSLIEKYFRYFERVNYEAADSIGLMSPRNLDLFDEQYQYKYNTHVLYNWADQQNKIQEQTIDLRKKYHLEDKVIFFYGGNIGHAQDMGNLLRLANSMKEETQTHFIFLGQGDEVGLVKQTIESKQLKNTTFLPSVSQNVYKQILTQIDVGLFSLAATHKMHNFPGKLLGYMVESLPMLGSVNSGNDVIDVITKAKAGFVFVNGHDNDFLDAAKILANNSEMRIKMGKNAHELLVQQFSVDSAAETILKNLY